MVAEIGIKTHHDFTEYKARSALMKSLYLGELVQGKEATQSRPGKR